MSDSRFATASIRVHVDSSTPSRLTSPPDTEIMLRNTISTPPTTPAAFGYVTSAYRIDRTDWMRDDRMQLLYGDTTTSWLQNGDTSGACNMA